MKRKIGKMNSKSKGTYDLNTQPSNKGRDDTSTTTTSPKALGAQLT
jgi:hypothetical protein